MPETETAEEIAKKPEVRKELERTEEQKAQKKVKAATTDKFWFVTHALLLIGCAVFYYFIGSKLIPLPQSDADLARRFLRGFALVVIVLAAAKSVRVYAIGRIEDSATRFTLRRILLLLAGLLIAVIVISVVFVNWYGALTALGIGSIIIGLAVQTPMKSFIAWIFILVRQPFRVGDRIKIGDATGDVIDVGYLDTTLWEFGGQYISGDHPSGRVIRFPNEKVLDEIEVREHPRVIFRVDEVTWIDAIVRYLVAPREAGPIKSRLIPKLLAALNAAPEKVMFPKGDAR